MQYMMLIHLPETPEAPSGPSDLSAEHAAYAEALDKAGVMLDAGRLQPAATASTVRVRNGRTEIVDGPYAEIKEQLAGFCLMRVKDRDEAIAWALRSPAAVDGTVELRAVLDPQAA
jgi:hypothetical protein